MAFGVMCQISHECLVSSDALGLPSMGGTCHNLFKIKLILFNALKDVIFAVNNHTAQSMLEF